MQKLDYDHTLRRIMGAPAALRKSYAERLSLARDWGFSSILVLPDDYLYRFNQSGMRTTLTCVYTKERAGLYGPAHGRGYFSRIYNPHKFEAWFNSAGTRTVSSIEDIERAEHEIIAHYITGASGFHFNYGFDPSGYGLTMCSSFWPSHHGALLLMDHDEALKLGRLVKAGEIGEVDTSIG